MPECYLLFASKEHSTKRVVFDKWSVYLIYTDDLENVYQSLQEQVAKCFIQNNCVLDGSQDDNLYKSVFNNMPLAWIQFFFQNETSLLRISQHCEKIEKELA